MKLPEFEDTQLHQYLAACEMCIDYGRKFTTLVNLYYKSGINNKQDFHKETMKYADRWGNSMRKCLHSFELSGLDEHPHIREYLYGNYHEYENDFSNIIQSFKIL